MRSNLLWLLLLIALVALLARVPGRRNSTEVSPSPQATIPFQPDALTVCGFNRHVTLDSLRQRYGEPDDTGEYESGPWYTWKGPDVSLMCNREKRAILLLGDELEYLGEVVGKRDDSIDDLHERLRRRGIPASISGGYSGMHLAIGPQPGITCEEPSPGPPHSESGQHGIGSFRLALQRSTSP